MPLNTINKQKDAIKLMHSNENDPTVDQKIALGGTDGSPGTGNEYVTDSDSRNTNARKPLVINVIISQVSITNTTSETTILTRTVPADSLSASTIIRFHFQGTHQNQDSSGTLTIRMYVGSNAGQIVQLASQSAISESFVEFEGMAAVRTAGASGTFITTGKYVIHDSATSKVTATQGGASTTSVDTTSSTVIKMTAQWESALADNSLLIQNALIEIADKA